MSRRAWIYVGTILGLGLASILVAFREMEFTQSQIFTWIVLIILATGAQLLKVPGPSGELFHPTLAFLFAGVLLLPPSWFVLLVIIPFVIEWIRERMGDSRHLRRWFQQPINISAHLLPGMVARYIYGLAGQSSPMFDLLNVLLAIFVVIVYLLMNHLIIGLAISMARRVSLREIHVLTVDNLVPDLALLFLGLVMAVLWSVNPLLFFPALSPLLLMYQGLHVPRLKQEAQTDDKTGLANARHFAATFTAELQRAKRFNRPLSIIMSDLDLLRNVNNTYGHLAGDAVLTGIGKVIRTTIRDYDFAGRFGGEEFAVGLPETGIAEAQMIAERMRQNVENTQFEIPTNPTPIHITMSFGIASFPEDGTVQTDLIHQADLAVFQAKLKGRNRVELASNVPHSARLESSVPSERFEPINYPVAERPVQIARPHQVDSAAPQLRTDLAPANSSRVYGFLFIAGVILLGSIITIFGFWQTTPIWTSILILAIVAVLAELFPVRMYGDSTMSVSATINFAAALITGVPGIVLVSLAIVATHSMRNRIQWYKSAFNWATHVIAAAIPAITLSVLGLAVTADNFIPLLIFVIVMSIIYYVVESGLITVVISLFENRSAFVTWRQEFKWMAVFYLALGVMGLFLAIIYQNKDIGVLGILAFLPPMAILYYSQQQYVERTKDSVNELRRMNQELSIANRQVGVANVSIREMNDELFLTLAKIIDARDPFVSGHAAQVAKYAERIAQALNLAPDRLDRVRQSALLHDIGKIGITERILHKPAKLNHDEYEIIKRHAELGADFLDTAQGLRHLAPFIRHHHEWWNGKGYPAGLVGEQIPLEARILAVCDAVEAMASDRAYHRAMSLEEIIAELQRASGTQFDPTVVQAFVKIAGQHGTDLVINSAREIVEKRDAKRHTLSEASKSSQPRRGTEPGLGIA